ncbi:plexin-A1-like isoform X2 [Mytilus trossulus]|uniref:plexin-A1-like isoform X2 n=1 Tax=Mytilus trossulus TaxID=6551 RepID=UPI003005296C
MPLNTVSGLWIIILSLTSKFSSCDGKSYRNYTEKFLKLAVSTDYVYIGGEKSLIQLDSSLHLTKQLNLQDQTNTYHSSWLLVVVNNKTLIECSHKLPDKTRCRNFNLELDVLEGTTLSLKIKQPSARYAITSLNLDTDQQDKNILILASSSCLNAQISGGKCYAISSYRIENGLTEVPKSGLGLDYYVTYKEKTKHVEFKTLFKIDKFVYVLLNTLEKHSKLGKICTLHPDVRYYPYEDTEIQCKHITKDYTMAQDAVSWDGYLYVAFSDDSSSVICRYKLLEIKKKFQISRKKRLKCPYAVENNYFEEKLLDKVGKKICYNETKQQCQLPGGNYTSCPELTDDNDGFCNTQFFGPILGNVILSNDKVIFSEDNSVSGAVVKLGVLPFDHHAVIYAGTATGKIGKIFVNTTDSKTLGIFKKVQISFPVLDIKIHNQDVYVMTENTVVNVADKNEPCPIEAANCEECMKSNNPACGWNIDTKECKPNPDNTVWWLPSIGKQCLELKVGKQFITEDDSSNSLTVIDVELKFEPPINLYDIYCKYVVENNITIVGPIRPTHGVLKCQLSVTKEDFKLTASLVNRAGTVDIASTTVKLYKCSSLRSCKTCVRSGQCHWCLKTTTCIINASACVDTGALIQPNEEQRCPAINSTKIMIPEQKTKYLKIPVVNIKKSDEDKLQCIIDGQEKSTQVENIEDTNYVVCKNLKFPKGDSTLYLNYSSSRLDGSLSLEAYDCKDYKSSCGSCKLKKFQGYQCDWCGTCKSTDSGIPGACTQECPVTVSKVNPESGPKFGGTLVDITGNNIGSPNDNISVSINGAQCSNVTVIKPFKIIRCITGNATDITSDSLTVTVNGEDGSKKNKFTYVDQHKLYGFAPNKSIIAGGKKIQIFGSNIVFPGSDYEIHFCNDSDCIACRSNKANKFKGNNLICRIEKSTGLSTLTYVKVIIDKHTTLEWKGEFKIVGNPKLQESDAASATVFKSGGSKITIPGSGFSNVGEVSIEGVEKLCTIKSDEKVECDAPPYVKSDFGRKKRATGQKVNIHFDGYMSSYTVYYAENPEFDKLTNVVEYEDGEEGVPIMIKGRSLLEGALQSDYTVKIGLDGTCLIQQISNWNITCLPPKSKPRTNHSDETIVFVVVEVGNIQDNLGNIRYITALPILPILIGVLGTALLVSVAVVITVVLASKRKRKGAEKKFQMELLVLEDKIRETSREEFADAQMTIRDIKSDLVTSRVPYCNYQSYAFHQLFPNQDSCSHSLLFEPMVTDDNRRKVQKAMDMFDKLMTNKLFMKSLVQTLESQNKLTPQDKAQFASLLSVCLLGNMKLFYQLIDCLLIGMIKAANKKQHKVLFRRFDTITQRLTVNWLALSLFDHLKKNGGMQLFMLYKATQTVIEKAPIDAITILCKNTLAEERLLKNRVEHEILTLDIDLNGNSDQRIPVIVLDCDTITQVKKKCCTAIYKNQPASEIPTPDELELEWHAGKSGKLTLQDIDNISDRSNGMIRLNTLKHYMVKNGSVMALMYKESSGPDDIYENNYIWLQQLKENQHVQGMVPTSTDHVKLLMPETAADNQDLKWHLVACSKNNRDVENFPEKSNLPDEEKSNKEHEIGEIFLNRLFHTKLILRDYIEACFEGITDSQSLSIPVRYFLCMIDKQGKEVGVDGDILQSWKSECYATRVWASLIAKPQILFDVNVPSHVEPCMDILKQVFIDSFTQCPQHVTKDASTQKLLFCKDIPEYRKNVNSFFIKVEAVNDQEFWKAMDEISSEQTKEMKFSRQATLHQLYKFIAKYKDEIIEDFQEKDETKDLAFGNKLEEVIDLMEEP